jgi:2-methylisocitrate lyase-like PEP mutase family enzyme
VPNEAADPSPRVRAPVHDGRMNRSELATSAARFRGSHLTGKPLLLPNAWDVASARAVVDSGFSAVATTSGGIASSLGWADGEKMPADEMFAAVSRIARAIEVPVTADIESGYGLPAEELAERLLQSGAVGCNLEDTDHAGGRGLVSVEMQAQRLAALKEAARTLGVEIVVNARIDVFVREVGEPDQRVAIALERARRYVEAGADCVYPNTASEEDLVRFMAGHAGPVNGLVQRGRVRLGRLLEIGLARISFGSGLQRLTTAYFRQRLAAISAGEDDWEGEPRLD